MLASKPIILSAPFMNYNIIEDADCGIVVPPESSGPIVEAILKIHDMPATRRRELGARGKEFILDNNTFEILANKLINVLEELE